MHSIARQKCNRDLEIPVDDESTVHVFESEDYFGAVEADFGLGEDAVLREVVVQVASVHQVEDKAQLLRRLKRIRHTYDERATLLRVENTHHASQQCHEIFFTKRKV